MCFYPQASSRRPTRSLTPPKQASSHVYIARNDVRTPRPSRQPALERQPRRCWAYGSSCAPARGTGRSMSDTQLSEPRSGPARPNAVHGLFECRDKLPADIARAAKIFGLALTSCQDVDRHNYCPEPPAAALCPVTCGTCQILEQRQTVPVSYTHLRAHET